MIIVGNIYAGLATGGGGGVSGADSGTGLVGGVVYLGVNPLLQDTVLDLGGFTLSIEDLVNNVGLIGTALFPVSGPDQYAQYGNLPVTNFKTFAGTGLSGPANVGLFDVPAGPGSVVRISPTLFLTVSSGLGIDVNVTWVDPAGNSKTELMVSGGAAENFPGESQSFYCQGGSVISIDTLVSGANVYDVLGIFEVII